MTSSPRPGGFTPQNKSHDAAALLNQALDFLKNKNYQEAEKKAKQAQKRLPKNPTPLSILGKISQESGHHSKAENLFKKALKMAPDNADLHKNLGLVQCAQEKYALAIQSLTKALALNPENHGVYRPLATAYRQMGQTEEAQKIEEQAADQAAQNPEALYNLGVMHSESQNHAEALQYYQQALRLDVGLYDAWINMGITLAKLAKTKEAIQAVSGGILTNPDEHRGKITLSNYCKDSQFTQFDPTVFDAITICLSSPYIAKQNFAKPWANLLFLHDEFKPFSTLQSCSDFEAFRAKVDTLKNTPDFQALLTHPYLLLGMKEMLITTIRAEKIFTYFRRYFLDAYQRDALKDLPDGFCTFLHALSIQCYNTEHVYYYGEEEAQAIPALRNELETGSFEDPDFKTKLSILGCYIPLIELSNAKDIAEAAHKSQDPILAALVLTQIADPLLEKSLAKEIPQFGSLEVPESQRNQKIYEDHPYPRWKSLNVHHQGDTSALDIDLLKHEINLTDSSEGANILIAGCGTGQHAISFSLNAPDTSILAIDYTLSSLSYAQRKSLEYGCKNITYMQADILELGDLGKKFKHIECSGVIHHIKDDRKAFRILKTLMHKNGTMKIGVYSKAAREYNAFLTQKYLRDQGFEPTPEGIREARHHLNGLKDKTDVKRISESNDYYALSTARFHLFDMDEKGYTLQELQEILDDLDLKFDEFELSPQHTQIYKDTFPDDPTLLNLDHFAELERENPAFFAGMYNFYVSHK